MSKPWIYVCAGVIQLSYIYLIWEWKGPDRTMDGKRRSGEG